MGEQAVGESARPPVSPWGIERTGYKTRSPLKPLGALARTGVKFVEAPSQDYLLTNINHLARNALNNCKQMLAHTERGLGMAALVIAGVEKGL